MENKTKKTTSISTSDGKVPSKKQSLKKTTFTIEQWKAKIIKAAIAYKQSDTSLANICKQNDRSALAATVNGLTNNNTTDNSEVAVKGRVAAKKLNILNRYIKLTLEQHESKDFNYDDIRKWYIDLLK